MEEIKELSVIEHRIYKVDAVPFRQLVTASNLNAFTSLFMFKDTEISEDASNNLLSVKMKLGEFNVDKKIYSIDQLLIDRRSIFFKIQSDSSIAKKFYQNICDVFSQINLHNHFEVDACLIMTSQTTCNVKLDFDFKELLSKTFITYINREASKKLTSAIDNKAKVEILPKTLVFNVNFNVTDNNLLENKISIASKPLTIEPRAGTSAKDRIYYTSSPSDTDTHLKILSTLEEAFKK